MPGWANESLGRSFLLPLKDMLLAYCFRNPDKATGGVKQKILLDQASVQACLTSSVRYYGVILMGVAAIICFAYIVRAGYIMFTAFGDEAKYAQGKKTLLYAIIGLMIAVASGFIISFFVQLLGYSGPNPFKAP